jgi:hypothetical protein
MRARKCFAAVALLDHLLPPAVREFPQITAHDRIADRVLQSAALMGFHSFGPTPKRRHWVYVKRHDGGEPDARSIIS